MSNRSSNPLPSFKQFVTPYLSPCCVCISSNTVTQLLRPNNISTIDILLQPYSFNIDSHTGLNIRSTIQSNNSSSVIGTLSTSNNTYNNIKTYNLIDYNIHFMNIKHIIQLDNDCIEKYLLSTLYQINNSQTRQIDNIRSVVDIPSFQSLHTLCNVVPHYNRFVNELIECTRYSKYDLISQPVVCILCCTTYDNDLLYTIQHLIDPSNLTELYNNNIYDINGIPKVILLLHDRHNTACIYSDIHDLMNKLTIHAQRIYGYDTIIKLLELNSIPLNQPNLHSIDQWKLYETRAQQLYHDTIQYTAVDSNHDSKHNTTPVDPLTYIKNTHNISSNNIVRGQYLSETDHLNITQFISELCSKSLIPSLEHRLSILYERVTNNRKGIKNQLRALFGRKATDKPNKPSYDIHTQLYDVQSIEYQTRLLGDICMYIQDYDNAAMYYKLFLNDCKHDNAVQYYHNTNELLGIALACIHSPTTHTPYDIAFMQYMNPYHSVRTAVYHTYYYIVHGQYLNAAELCVRSAERLQNSLSGCILEYSAYCYLWYNYIRKYSFHLILSANLYSKNQLTKYLSNRCYLTAINIYTDQLNYYYCNLFIYYNIARNYYYFNEIEKSIEYYTKIITHKNESPKNIQFFNELLYIITDTIKHNKLTHQIVLHELQCPLVIHDSIKFINNTVQFELYNYLYCIIQLTQLQLIYDSNTINTNQQAVSDTINVDFQSNTRHVITLPCTTTTIPVGISYCINQTINVQQIFHYVQPTQKRKKLFPK